jgi:hypothetical protein
VRRTSQTSAFATCLATPTQLVLTWVRGWAAVVLSVLMLAVSPGARAEPITLDGFDLVRSEEGLTLSFSARFELSRAVDDALQKGVPLFFVAQAEVFRNRWYWRDKEVASVTRTWRLAYQPLTRKYRVTFGGLNQNFDSLPDALASVRRVTGWKIADAREIDDGGHYVEFRYRLDTTLLPRPMQIGIGGQPEWTLLVERTERFK